jgi:GNAT superfamily N-acetyltransferase
LLSCAADPGTRRFFFAHPLSRGFARQLCDSRGFARQLCDTLDTRRDRYYLMVAGTRVAAYGLLRGWDEGYAIPCLGLCVHPQLQGLKVGTYMMAFCLAAAKAAGVEQVRWTVDPENLACVRGANKFGFLCEDSTTKRLLFKADLGRPSVQLPEMDWACLQDWASGTHELGCEELASSGDKSRAA